MHDPVMERATLAARHDFDLLPKSTEIEVQPARHSELSALADMANRLVPGVQITEPDLERYFSFDPGSLLTFSRKNRLLGAVAFIYLNCRGHDALMHADMNLTRPDFGLLAGRSDQVSAIYVWAIAGHGRAMAGLGNVSTHLSAQFDDRDRLRTDREPSAGTLALPAALESRAVQRIGSQSGEESCRCTAVNPHRRILSTSARSRSASRAIPTT